MNLTNLANQIQNILHLRESNAKDFESFPISGPVLRLALRNLIEFRCRRFAARQLGPGLVRTPHLRSQMQSFWIQGKVRRQLNAKYFGTV
jgi:hypothetical protein